MVRIAWMALLLAAPVLAQEPPLPEGAVPRVGSPRWRHAGEICAITYSADSKLLAVASRDGIVIVRDAATGRERRRFNVETAVPQPSQPAGQFDIASEPKPFAAVLRFTTDNTRLLVASPGALRAFDLSNGKLLFSHSIPPDSNCLAISPD